MITVAIIFMLEFCGILALFCFMLKISYSAIEPEASAQKQPFAHNLWAGSDTNQDRVQQQEQNARLRAEAYLQRIVALTGAKQDRHERSCYVLTVGEIQFKVRDRHVRRIPATNNSSVAYGQTCFYPPNEVMPAAERIASALLQLKSNPALFDCWATQCGCFKPDATLFAEELRGHVEFT